MEKDLTLDLELAKSSLENRKYDEAKNRYKIILRSDPTNPTALCGLGLARYGTFEETESEDEHDAIHKVFKNFRMSGLEADEMDALDILVINQSFEVIKNLYLQTVIVSNINEDAKRQTINRILHCSENPVLSKVLVNSDGKPLLGGLGFIKRSSTSINSNIVSSLSQLPIDDAIKKFKYKIRYITKQLNIFALNDEDIATFDGRVKELDEIVKELQV